MTTPGTERGTVQTPLVRYMTEIGWTELPADEALSLRGGETGMLLRPVLRDKLIALNPGVVDLENVDRLINQIESARSSIEGNVDILRWLRGLNTFKIEKDKLTRNITVIDFTRPAENRFHVTSEWRYTNGRKPNRADVMFLINGIPVAIVEAKRTGMRDALSKGLTQVRRYHEETPELMTPPQLFGIPTVKDFLYGVTWNLDHKSVFNWKDEQDGDFERRVKMFFARERFLKVIRDWIVVSKRDEELQKFVLRQHQIRAVEKVVERCLDPMKHWGLIWHTQGSGKTFTMIKSAELILCNPAFKSPTVVMLIDRNELETQLVGNFMALGIEPKVADSIRDLRNILSSDYRGLIVSMIHKFEGADADLCTRENVFVLIDESHRTTGGTLGNYLTGALPKATFIGFTGTPIDKTAYGQGTFKVFGKEDERGYLDKYSTADSIRDKTTVPLNYALAPNIMRVPEELLDKEFLALKELEGVSDIEELNRVLDRAVHLKSFLKSAERVEQVAKFVIEHFRTNVEPLGYKAFLVAVDREACALYKQALDKLMPSDETAVVYTQGPKDTPLMRQHYVSSDQEKMIRREFRKPGNKPKILIVTEKLLTGYDAPVLYSMYLDKPMRDHTLLQAISRVNRPYEDDRGREKRAGLVVDFVGIFGRLEKALAFDSEFVPSVIDNIELLQKRFAEMMAGASDLIALAAQMTSDKGVEKAAAEFRDKEKREKFFETFQQLQVLYDIVSPDPFLRPFLADFENLVRLYREILEWYRPETVTDGELSEKTEQLVRNEVKTYGLTGTTKFATLDENALEYLRRKHEPDEVKVLNLTRLIRDKVKNDGAHQPYLIPIAERVENIRELFEDRQISTQDAIKDLEIAAQRIIEAEKERNELGFDKIAYDVFVMLREQKFEGAKELAPKIRDAFGKFGYYRTNDAVKRDLKAELYQVLMGTCSGEKRKRLVDLLLTKKWPEGAL